MGWPIVAAAAATAVAGYLSSQAQSSAAQKAAEEQSESYKAGIAEQRRQFEAIQKLLAPYVEAGNTALTSQLALIGLGGEEAQQKAIQGIETSPMFKSLVRQGEESLLQSASATGGSRGGDIKGILAQYRPAMLKNEIESQFSKLGQISNLGQASAAQQVVAGGNTGTNISNLLSSEGDAQAQAALLSGQADARLYGTIGQSALLAGYLYGNSGSGGGGGGYTTNYDEQTGRF
jgi:curli biogenesis system outer membrane secretion channel CsgG